MKCTFLTNLIYHYSEKEYPTKLFSLTNGTFLSVKVFPVHFPGPFWPGLAEAEQILISIIWIVSLSTCTHGSRSDTCSDT